MLFSASETAEDVALWIAKDPNEVRRDMLTALTIRHYRSASWGVNWGRAVAESVRDIASK